VRTDPTRHKIRTITVSSSSKKSGKSSVAAFLVRELGIDFALKVSSGGHTPTHVVTDPEVISRPGTDTGSLVQAGARQVIWVNAPASRLATEIGRAVAMFPPEGTLIVEGNSALKHLAPDFAVFVMTVPFEEFKPSARTALARADLVLVDGRWRLAGSDSGRMAEDIMRKTDGARVVFFDDDEGFHEALIETARLARKRLRPGG
jgi:hypothetical protein